MLAVKTTQIPLDVTVKHLNPRSLILEQEMIEGDTHESLEKSAVALTGDSKQNAINSLDLNYTISNDSIMDFGFLPFCEDKMNQTFDSASLDSDDAFPHLKGIDQRLTISTNEVNYS